MKKFIFCIICVISLCTLNSCSNVDDDLTDTSQTSNLQSTDYQNFMFRIDSLNAVYQASVLNDPTRGLVQYIANSKIESLADNAGRVVGGYLGRGLGSFVVYFVSLVVFL